MNLKQVDDLLNHISVIAGGLADVSWVAQGHLDDAEYLKKETDGMTATVESLQAALTELSKAVQP